MSVNVRVDLLLQSDTLKSTIKIKIYVKVLWENSIEK